MTRAATAVHDPTDACWGRHCHIHNVDEPDNRAYQVCLECGHVYPTARALRRDYRREYWRIASDDQFGREPVWRRLWRVATVRASRVSFCQHCVHDFVWMPARRSWFRRGGDAA
jgi:hypothetical protein